MNLKSESECSSCDENRERELRQNVPELPDQRLVVTAMQSNAKQQKNRAAVNNVRKSLSSALATVTPLTQGIRHGDANDEHEEGLNEIPEPQPVPGMVLELLNQGVQQAVLANKLPDGAMHPCRVRRE